MNRLLLLVILIVPSSWLLPAVKKDWKVTIERTRENISSAQPFTWLWPILRPAIVKTVKAEIAFGVQFWTITGENLMKQVWFKSDLIEWVPYSFLLNKFIPSSQHLTPHQRNYLELIEKKQGRCNDSLPSKGTIWWMPSRIWEVGQSIIIITGCSYPHDFGIGISGWDDHRFEWSIDRISERVWYDHSFSQELSKIILVTHDRYLQNEDDIRWN